MNDNINEKDKKLGESAIRSGVAVSTHNIVKEGRKTTGEDVSKFLKHRKSVLDTLEEKTR